MVNNHSHELEAVGRRGRRGRTRGAGVNNHTHAYSINSDGDVTIGEAEGHTHTAPRVSKQRDDDMNLKERHAVIPFEVKQLNEDPSGKFFRFKGLASTFGNVDFGGDIVQPKAFHNTILEMRENKQPILDLPGEFKLLPILWQHDMSEPLGSFVSIEETPEGLVVEGVMPKSDTFVSGRVIPQMRIGSVGQMSIGYIVKQSSRDGEGNRLLEEIFLFETSLVTVAMNPKALVNEMKGVVKFQNLPLAGRDSVWSPSAAAIRVKEFGEDYPDAGVNAFLYVDPESKDIKFQIADIVDGKMTVIPQAVFLAAASIKIDKTMTRAQKGAAVDSINKYYDKIGLESPFVERECLRVDDLGALDERTLEKTLKTGGVFPGEVAKTIVSALKSFMRDAEKDEKRDADQKEADDLLAEMKSINSKF